MDSFFFGCELSGHTRSFTFKVEEEDDTEHVLALNMLCLTEGAKDECNVVEVVARDHDHQEIAVPVANLRLSCQPMLSLDDFQLQPPVTFRLKSGSGPVRITGRHQIVCINNDLSEEESEGESEEEIKLCGILPAKKRRGRPRPSGEQEERERQQAWEGEQGRNCLLQVPMLRMFLDKFKNGFLAEEDSLGGGRDLAWC